MTRDMFPGGLPNPRPDKREPEESRVERKADGNLLAFASLIIGMISLFGFGLLGGPLSILLGFLSKKDCSKKSIAIAGIVCGCVAFVISLILLFLFRNASPPVAPSSLLN